MMNTFFQELKITDPFFIQDPLKKRRFVKDEEFGMMAFEKKPEKWVKTVCGYCSLGCGMLIGIKDGKAVSVKGDPDYPVNRGKLCPKGLSEHHSLYGKNRALFPMQRIRKNGKFFKISWDEAYNITVQKFRDIQSKYGNDSVAVISTGQMLTEEFYALGKLVRFGLKTGNYDGNTTLCMSTAVAGYTRSFGTDGPPGTYEDIEKAECLILMGANPADNHPVLMKRILNGKGINKTIITVDPRITKTAVLSDIHLPVKPRGDLALLNGIMHIIIEKKMYDKNYIKNHTADFETLKKGVMPFTPEYTAEITGLTPELIMKTALLYGSAKKSTIAWTMGVNHSSQGVKTVNAINNLSLLTGNVGKAGSSPFSITGQCNAMGSRETAFTASMPGYRSFLNDSHRRELSSLWKIPEDEIPSERGQAYPDIIESIVQGKIKALWIIATNPLVSFPNQGYLEDALSRLEFTVLQDGFHQTPSSAYADIIFPSAVWGEKEGVFTNSERRVGRANKAVEPPGTAKSDFEIFLGMSEKLGIRDKIYPGWTKAEDAFNEWKKISENRPCDCSGMNYDLIEKSGGIQWPFSKSNEISQAAEERRLYSDGSFNTPDGRAKFIFSEPEENPESLNENYSFTLNTGRTVEHWHTRTKTGEIKILEEIAPEPWIEINPEDAENLGIQNGEKIRVASRRGVVENIKCKITSTVRSKEVFMPFHWSRFSANQLTINAYDPISREPNFKQSAVRLEKMKSIR